MAAFVHAALFTTVFVALILAPAPCGAIKPIADDDTVTLQSGVVHHIWTRPPLCTIGIELVTIKGRPKTGTTWTEYLMGDLLLSYCKLNPKICKSEGKWREYPGVSVHYLKENCTFYYHIKYVKTDNQNKHSRVAWDDNNIPSSESIVYTVRDPRDTSVSHCYWHLGLSCDTHDYLHKSFFAAMSYMSVNTRRAQELGVLVLPYEASQQLPLLTMHRLSRYLGMPLPDSDLLDIYNRNAFEAMRSKELNGTLEGRQELPSDLAAIETSRVKTRKGKVGSYEDEFSLADIRWANKQIRAFMPPEWYACYVTKTLQQPCFPNIHEHIAADALAAN